MLTYNQKYSIATMLATGSLEQAIKRIQASEFDSKLSQAGIEFAKIANKYFIRRDGFIPTAVVNLCKIWPEQEQEQTTPEASRPEMTEWQLTKLQQVLTEATKANAIPLELSYIFSAALCELCDAIKRSPERIRKEYGDRLYAQLEQYVQK